LFLSFHKLLSFHLPFPGEPKLEGPEGPCSSKDICIDGLTDHEPPMLPSFTLCAKELPHPRLPELAILRPNAKPGALRLPTKADLTFTLSHLTYTPLFYSEHLSPEPVKCV
jgi:hypothetical protein